MEEREHGNFKVVERRVALLLRGEQTLDKKNDNRDTRSDTRVLNSDPTQAQPIRDVMRYIKIGVKPLFAHFKP